MASLHLLHYVWLFVFASASLIRFVFLPLLFLIWAKKATWLVSPGRIIYDVYTFSYAHRSILITFLPLSLSLFLWAILALRFLLPLLLWFAVNCCGCCGAYRCCCQPPTCISLSHCLLSHSLPFYLPFFFFSLPWLIIRPKEFICIHQFVWENPKLITILSLSFCLLFCLSFSLHWFFFVSTFVVCSLISCVTKLHPVSAVFNTLTEDIFIHFRNIRCLIIEIYHHQKTCNLR